MVELQIVVLAVAGSSPVGHPRALPRAKSQIPMPRPQRSAPIYPWEFGFWVLGFPPSGGVACPLLKHGYMLNPAVIDSVKAHDSTSFWTHILNNEELQNFDDLEKLVVGCEIIAALDAVDLLAA
jgi:hypothetical protein